MLAVPGKLFFIQKKVLEKLTLVKKIFCYNKNKVFGNNKYVLHQCVFFRKMLHTCPHDQVFFRKMLRTCSHDQVLITPLIYFYY